LRRGGVFFEINFLAAPRQAKRPKSVGLPFYAIGRRPGLGLEIPLLNKMVNFLGNSTEARIGADRGGDAERETPSGPSAKHLALSPENLI
jgi:hypothetical protein